MGETARRHVTFWIASVALFIGFVALFKSVLLPFVLGMTIAYLLNPLVRKLCAKGLSRGAVAFLILFIFFSILLALVALAAPYVERELSDLSDNMPYYIDRVFNFLQPYLDHLQGLLGHSKAAEPETIVTNHMESVLGHSSAILSGFFSGSMALAHTIGIVVVMPIVSYFMMKEWPHITGWITGLLPKDQTETIMNLLKQIDKKLHGYLRGQLGVMFALGIGYSIALSMAGLKYSVLIGLLTGLLTFIPFVGTAFGFVSSVTVAFFQSGGDIMFIGIIAAIFISGQLIESNFLTPFLVGGSVGLHPLWILFALMAGGSLFGILGMILAVPVAAIASVLIAFAIARYKDSSYYKGKK